jgi:hypothetical protein
LKHQQNWFCFFAGETMNTILSFIKRHSFATFVVLAYLLSWWSAPFTNGQIIPYGPAVAAVIVLVITSGRSGCAACGAGSPLARRLVLVRDRSGDDRQLSAGAYVLNLLMGRA